MPCRKGARCEKRRAIPGEAMTRLAHAVGLVLCCLAGFAGPARAWPDQPVRIVVPFAAGGTTDVIARLLAEKLTPLLGQPVLIENVGGAGGNTGATLVAKSPPNGNAVLMGTPGPTVMNQFMYARMPYDTATAFAPIALVASTASVLMAGPKIEAQSLTEFIALMRKRPEGVNYGSAGLGSTGHLGGALFGSIAGLKAQHVPYRGSEPMLQDLMAGNIQFTIDSIPGAIGLIRGGAVRALAVTARNRVAELPDIPTTKEAGLPEVEVYTWVALFAPAGTPPSVVVRINAEVNAALKDPELRRKISEQGAKPEGGSVDEFTTFLNSERVRWKRAVEIAGVKVE
jgi:tripartite-type tricarboxylate transporter receptor subunit TctC